MSTALQKYFSCSSSEERVLSSVNEHFILSMKEGYVRNTWL